MFKRALNDSYDEEENTPKATTKKSPGKILFRRLNSMEDADFRRPRSHSKGNNHLSEEEDSGDNTTRRLRRMFSREFLASHEKDQREHLTLNDVTQTQFNYVVSQEIRKDGEGFLSQQEVTMMGGLSAVQLASLVADKKVIRLLVNDKKQTVKRSLRHTICRQSIRKSLRENYSPKHAWSKIKEETLQEIEDRVVDLINGPADLDNEGERDLNESEDRIRESIRFSLIQMKKACPNVKTALKSSIYWQLCFMAFCGSISNYSLNCCWKEYFEERMPDTPDKQMALMFSVGAFVNSFTRVFSGFATMRYDFKALYFVLIISSSICSLTIDYGLINYVMGMIYTTIFMAGIGLHITIFPSVCTKIFGSVVGPKVFPGIIACYCLACWVQWYIVWVSSEWSAIWMWMGVICLVGGGVMLLVFDEAFDWKEAWDEAEKIGALDQNDKPLLNK